MAIATPKAGGSMTRSMLLNLSLSLALALGLLACATATPYTRAVNEKDDGFRDQKIEGARYRVSFSGNESTSKETAELYVLYRSAELTLANGFDYFIMTEPDKESETRYMGTGTGLYGGTRFGRGRMGFGGIGIGFGGSGNPNRKYDVSSYITMHKGAAPKDNPKAFVAAEVKESLEARIVRPK